MPTQKDDQTAQYIVLGIQSALSLLGLFQKLADDFKQDAEMSPEQEAALDAKIADIPKQAFNTPDAET
jgi:hypothetical protein